MWEHSPISCIQTSTKAMGFYVLMEAFHKTSLSEGMCVSSEDHVITGN